MIARGHVRSDLSARTLRSGHGVMFRSIVVAMIAAAGCAKKSESTHAPEAADGAGAMATSDIDALERELAGREAQLRSMGYQGVGLVGQTDADDLERSADAGGADLSAKREEGETRPSAKVAETAPVAEAQSPEPGVSRNRAERDRCETVCELSASICQLQDHICGLVPRHSDEPRYQAACERATADCRMSTEACHACP